MDILKRIKEMSRAEKIEVDLDIYRYISTIKFFYPLPAEVSVREDELDRARPFEIKFIMERLIRKIPGRFLSYCRY